MKKLDYYFLLEKEIVKKEELKSFIRGKVLYSAYSLYGRDNVRVLILEGMLGKTQVVLKIYNDYCFSDEPLALGVFNKQNISKILKAPQLYDFGIISPCCGWMIMEKLPENARSFERPLVGEARKEFLEVYLEYKKVFPQKAHRKLTIVEQLPADEFYFFQMQEYLNLAQVVLNRGEMPFFNFSAFIFFYLKVLKRIRVVFSQRSMIWGHGNFKSSKIFKNEKGMYFLIDFGHCQMYPEGDDLAHIVWKDWVVLVGRMEKKLWIEGVFKWIEILRPIAEELGIVGFEELIKASLLVKIIRTILVNIISSDEIIDEEKVRKIILCYNLASKLL